jgi:hypothetical protein
MLGQERFHALESASASFAANQNNININIQTKQRLFWIFQKGFFYFTRRPYANHHHQKDQQTRINSNPEQTGPSAKITADI